MNADFSSHLQLGMAAAMLAMAALLVMVFRELAPIGGLSGRGRWLLAGGLGLGVLVFASKLLAMVVMLNVPQHTLRPLVERTVMRGQPIVHAQPPERPLPAVGRYVWTSLPEVAPAPLANPTTAAKVALGRALFHDQTLSADGSLACASCHAVEELAGADGRPTAKGIHGQIGTRNVPTVWNAAFQSRQFWDGRAASLEAQAVGPLVNPAEMGMPSLHAVESRVTAQPRYRAQFQAAFGDERIDIARIAAAIASFERTLVSTDTPYDRFVRGDARALNASQLRGMALFDGLGCTGCHGGANFSAASVFDPHAPLRSFPAYASPLIERYRLHEDPGLARPGSPRALWRVPSLRNVALTGPYFHNGAVTNLADAVRVMASAQLGLSVAGVAMAEHGDGSQAANALYWSPAGRNMISVTPRPRVSQRDVEDLVAFLEALSSERLRAAAKL